MDTLRVSTRGQALSNTMQTHSACGAHVPPDGANRPIWWYLLWRKREYSMGRVISAGTRKWKIIFEQDLENSEWIRETFGERMFLTEEIGCAKALRQRVPRLLEALVKTWASLWVKWQVFMVFRIKEWCDPSQVLTGSSDCYLRNSKDKGQEQTQGVFLRRLLEWAKEEKAIHREEDIIQALTKSTAKCFLGKTDLCSILFKAKQNETIKSKLWKGQLIPTIREGFLEDVAAQITFLVHS